MGVRCLVNYHQFAVFMLINIWSICTVSECSNSVTQVDIHNEDVVLVDSTEEFRPRRVYHLEDFFWTGSGDGAGDIDSEGSDWEPSGPTVFYTTTIVSTMIISASETPENPVSRSSPTIVTSCIAESSCEYPGSPTPAERISPPTATGRSAVDGTRYTTPDRRYWLVTVLQTPANHDPAIAELERKLAELYRTAFYRQQERHLGILHNNSTHTTTPSPFANLMRSRKKRRSLSSKRSQTKMPKNSNSTSENEIIINFINIAATSPNDTTFKYNSTNKISPTQRIIEINDTDLSINNNETSLNIGNTENTDSNLTSRESRHKRITASSSAVAPGPKDEPVLVQIHNMSRASVEEVALLYSVRVDGRPVLARTAAADMALVSHQEVARRLGYDIRTKAEPYLKEESIPMGLTYAENQWLLIGSGIAAACVLLLLLVLLAMGLKHRRPKEPPPAPTPGPDAAHADAGVQTKGTSTFITPAAIARAYNARRLRPLPSESSESSAVGTQSSSEPSPTGSAKSRENIAWKSDQRVSGIQTRYRMIRERREMPQQQRRYEDEFGEEHLESAGSGSAGVNGRRPTDVTSNASYLSMPSVKCFPKSSIPEPLSRVLEPVSVRHLDEGGNSYDLGDGDGSPLTRRDVTPTTPKTPPLRRHASIGASDPGVIGPLVWSQHCQRLQQVRGEDVPVEGAHAGRMRKRFQELLDDAFSLFGSRSASPEQVGGNVTQQSSPTMVKPAPRKIDMRVHSACPRLLSEPDIKTPPQARPRTTDPKQGQQIAPELSEPPETKGAWDSRGASPLVRPLSAGPFHRPSLSPHVCTTRILTDATLPSNDPALPLIATIKDELNKKCTK